MLRTPSVMATCALIKANVGLHEFINTTIIYTQCVRWRRKPIWLPMAKTKLFKIPPERVVPPEEHDEMKRLCNNYRTYMKSLREHFKEYTESHEVQYDHDSVKAAEDADFAECSAINDAWNAERAKERKVRMAERRQKQEADIAEEFLRREQVHIEEQEKIAEHIRQLKAETTTYITEENIDEAIEKALATIIDYNTIIDLDGNIYSNVHDSVMEDDNLQSVHQV